MNVKYLIDQHRINGTAASQMQGRTGRIAMASQFSRFLG
jgi:hypothetical protein